ncbi:FUSC family protein [Microbacterium sp. NPDC057659]|uniref:FUSC family protein n=1 Tax=Microbacterium sp. NPDC057659 TaxID=3346198 RepID=UPI00366D3484
MSGSEGAPADGRRLLLLSAVAVVVAIIPVGAAWLLAGALAAQALYLGIVLTSAVVRSLPLGMQAASAVWFAAVSAAGVLIGPRPVPLLIAVVLCCLAQAPITRMDARAVAVAPAILVFYALIPPAGSSAWTVAVATLIGAAFMIGVARLAKIVPVAQPLDTTRAMVHSVLLAIGCAVLLLLGPALGMGRINWGLLAFCLVFVPGRGSTAEALRYAAATAAGAVAAVLIGLLTPPWLVLIAVFAGAVLTVAYSLQRRATFAIAFIAGTVILLGTLVPGADATLLGAQRLTSALLAVAIAIVLMAVADPAERMLAHLFSRNRPEGSASWTR